MSIGGGGGDDTLAANAESQRKSSKRAEQHVRRLSNKIEKKGENFFNTWVKDQLPDIKGLTADLQGRFDELDGMLGDLGNQFGDIGASIQDQIDAAGDYIDDMNPFKDQIASISSMLTGVSEETERAYMDAADKQARDDQMYNEQGKPIFEEYAGAAREAAAHRVGVEDKVAGAIGDVAGQEALHSKNVERQLAARGVQQNASSMNQTGAQFALAKAFAANKAKSEGEATNRALQAQGVGIMANLNQAGQGLDKAALNQGVMQNIRGQQGQQLQQQAGLTAQSQGITESQAAMNSNVANLKALQGDVLGKQSNVASLQAQVYGQKAGLQSQQLADISGAQAVMLQPYTTAMSGHSNIYQTSTSAMSSAMETNAKISSQEDQAASAGAGKLFGTVLGMFA